VEVKPIPGLEHLPFAEVWFHAVDEASWREASAAASALAKTGLEVWTTDASPEVIDFLERREYERGIGALRTATEVRLARMRALDERLGYVCRYEEVVLRGPVAAA
jgi:hypothetical protein